MKKIYALLLVLSMAGAKAQNTKNEGVSVPPLKIPLSLAGNFGELRPNHFHSGIDIKTQGRTGLPVYSIADGYVSRISISPYGYGNALYLTHSGGITSVYGHLQDYSKFIRDFIRKIQYEKQTFALDTILPVGLLPVSKGQQVALSGNSGSSGGPHLHFEIRDTESEHALNPLIFKFPVKDTTPPRILSAVVYPLSDDALVNGQHQKRIFETIASGKSFQLKNNPSVSVSGTVGFGLQAYDFLDGSPNKCGVYTIELKIDNEVAYSFKMDEFGFDEARYINSQADYEDRLRHGRNIYKAWVEPGNKLQINHDGTGMIHFEKEGKHMVSLDVADVAGNSTHLSFPVIVRNLDGVVPIEKKGIPFKYNEENVYEADGIRAVFPEGSFYTDLDFTTSVKPGTERLFSPVYELHNIYTPVHRYFSLSIKPQNLPDDLQKKALLVSVNPAGGQIASAGGLYRDGVVTGSVRTLGCFAVAVDTVAPRITSLSIKNNALTEQNRIRFKISDNLSGIDSWAGYIDGKWVLFEFDGKSATLTYTFDQRDMKFGRKHQLKLQVSDAKNNVTVYTASFTK